MRREERLWNVSALKRARLSNSGILKICKCIRVTALNENKELLYLKAICYLRIVQQRRWEINRCIWDPRFSRQWDGIDVSLLPYNVGGLQPWRWRPYVSPTRRYLPVSPHGLTDRNTKFNMNRCTFQFKTACLIPCCIWQLGLDGHLNFLVCHKSRTPRIHYVATPYVTFSFSLFKSLGFKYSALIVSVYI